MPSPECPRNNTLMLIVGTIIFGITSATWLYGETHGIDTTGILAFAVPIVGALFISNGVGAAREAAERAAHQTNGGLDARIRAQVTAALSDRDSTRAHQANLDNRSNNAESVPKVSE